MKGLLSIVLIVVFALALGACKHRPATGNSNSGNTTPAPAYNSSDPAERERAKNDARTYLEQGNELYQNDQDQEALAAYQKAIEQNPELAEAYYRLGLTYAVLDQAKEAEGAYKKAIELYRKFTEENPNDADAYFNLGESHRYLHQYEDAVRAYKQAVRLQPEDPEMFYELGVTQIKLAQYSEATSALQKAIDLDPDYYRASDALDDAREGVKRVRDGKKHQEEMLKKQQADELKKQQEGTVAPAGTPK